MNTLSSPKTAVSRHAAVFDTVNAAEYVLVELQLSESGTKEAPALALQS